MDDDRVEFEAGVVKLELKWDIDRRHDLFFLNGFLVEVKSINCYKEIARCLNQLERLHSRIHFHITRTTEVSVFYCKNFVFKALLKHVLQLDD